MQDNNPYNQQPQQNYQQSQPNSIYAQPQPLLEKIKQPKILGIIGIVLLLSWVAVGIPLFDSIFHSDIGDNQDNEPEPEKNPCKKEESKIITLNKSLENTNNLLSACNSEKAKLDNNITNLNTALTTMTNDLNETNAGLTVCLLTKEKYFDKKQQLQNYLDQNLTYFNSLFCHDQNWMHIAIDFNTTIQEKETDLAQCEIDVSFWQDETATAIQQKNDLNILYGELDVNYLALQQDYNDSTNLIFDLNQLINSDFNIYNPTEVRQTIIDLNALLCNYKGAYCG